MDHTSLDNPLKVLAKIRDELQDYGQMLYSDPANRTGPVQVIVTGGHNFQDYAYVDPAGNLTKTSVRNVLLTDTSYDKIYLDGVLSKDYDVDAKRIPLVSFSYPATDGCGVNEDAKLNPGSPPRTTTDTVNEILDAHVHHHQVWVWGLPDCPARGGTDDPAYKAGREKAWNDAKFAGVDYISSNHLQYLQDWLLSSYNDPAQGGGACGDQTEIPLGVHYGDIKWAQYCTLWTGKRTGVRVQRSELGHRGLLRQRGPRELVPRSDPGIRVLLPGQHLEERLVGLDRGRQRDVGLDSRRLFLGRR
jgi:hypothetical protein